MDALQANARDLEQEFAWLAELLDTRFKLFFRQETAQTDVLAIQPPDLDQSGSPYAGFVRHYQMTLTEVWEGLKAAIPAALIGILIEKLVAMIVPAAGAVLLIVQGIQAAWGSVQRIIAAFGKFFTFVKAVKSGAAGPQFAEMLAAAAIVVIDFVSFWLLKKLRGPASKIGAKIKAIAM